MKKYFSILTFIGAIALVMAGCHKVADLPYYENGTAVTLTSNKTSVAPTPADSLNSVVTFNWTSPKYATDTSTYKFVLEIDSSGRNFSKKVTKNRYWKTYHITHR